MRCLKQAVRYRSEVHAFSLFTCFRAKDLTGPPVPFSVPEMAFIAAGLEEVLHQEGLQFTGKEDRPFGR